MFIMKDIFILQLEPVTCSSHRDNFIVAPRLSLFASISTIFMLLVLCFFVLISEQKSQICFSKYEIFNMAIQPHRSILVLTNNYYTSNPNKLESVIWILTNHVLGHLRKIFSAFNFWVIYATSGSKMMKTQGETISLHKYGNPKISFGFWNFRRLKHIFILLLRQFTIILFSMMKLRNEL